MQTSVTFKNIDSSDHLKSFIQDKLNRLDKLLDNPAEANVVLSVEKFRHIAEISLSGDRLNIVGKEETNDMYSAIDMVLDKLETQLKKNKQKIKKRRPTSRKKNKGFDSPDMQYMEEDIPRKVKIQNIEYKPMDVEEAVMQMDLVDDHFFVFTNARTDRVNVLYRRSDGDYGLIQPNRI
ncbi:MAG: ribosome-associated translation inhibitor RaiA [Desulfobacteraceae bacterium]|nr:MAG: ribosome-associated translation inhibitor RaiA [Desulfobacteraceae bacterium]